MGRASRKRRALGYRPKPVPIHTVAPKPKSHSPIVTWEAARALDELAVLAEERRLLEARVEGLVRGLSNVGVSWAEIGRSLGMTRQGARQRYGSQPVATTVVVSTETSV
jgi:hypothetical protein